MGSSSFRKPSGTNSFPTSRRYRGDAAPADDILKALLKRHGLDVKIAKYQFVRHWEELVGRQIADQAKPDTRRRCIYIDAVITISGEQSNLFCHMRVKSMRKYRCFFPLFPDLHHVQQQSTFSSICYGNKFIFIAQLKVGFAVYEIIILPHCLGNVVTSFL